MLDCGDQTDRYTFCMRFGPNIRTYYYHDDLDTYVNFTQNESCQVHPDSWYDCKYSGVSWNTDGLQVKAIGKQVAMITKGVE